MYNSLKPKVIDKLRYRTECTPDWKKFCSKTNIPVLVYDNIKFGLGYHYIVKDSVYYGEGITFQDTFIGKVSSFTTLFASIPANLQAGRIKGEVYGVEPETLFHLDRHYQNGVADVSRKYMWVGLSNQGKNVNHQCWVYLTNDLYRYKDDPLIPRNNNYTGGWTPAMLTQIKPEFGKNIWNFSK
jgi:gamma-glutamylcyclotransferase (GGCT)/AIG2-like uncharacterized protein YtfP